MKYFFILLLVIALFFGVSFSSQASSFSWDFTSGIVRLIAPQNTAEVRVPYITATSTASSTLPRLVSTTICLTGDICRTTWPTGGGSQTPWTSNIDGGGFSLTNVLAITATSGNYTILTVTATSTLATTSLTRGLLDSTASIGVLGMVLQSTGTSTIWLATSTLGIGTNYLNNSGVNTFLNTGTNLQSPTYQATSTTGTSTFAGAVGIGTTTPATTFAVVGRSTTYGTSSTQLSVVRGNGSPAFVVDTTAANAHVMTVTGANAQFTASGAGLIVGIQTSGNLDGLINANSSYRSLLMQAQSITAISVQGSTRYVGIGTTTNANPSALTVASTTGTALYVLGTTTLDGITRITGKTTIGTSSATSTTLTISSASSTASAVQSNPFGFLIDMYIGATYYAVLTFDYFGHWYTSGPTPTLVSCGTAPAVKGNDKNGTVTVGTAATGCAITFAQPWTTAPDCVISNQSMSIVSALTYTISTTALTLSQATGLSSNKVNYHCIASQ